MSYQKNSTQAKYRIVNTTERTEDDSGNKANPIDAQTPEVRIRHDRPAGLYISKAAEFLLATEPEKRQDRVILSAIDSAIPVALTVADVLCRRIKDLGRILRINRTVITNTYEPLEEGLDVVKEEKSRSTLKIILKFPTTPEEPGFDRPPANLVEPKPLDQITGFKRERRTGDREDRPRGDRNERRNGQGQTNQRGGRGDRDRRDNQDRRNGEGRRDNNRKFSDDRKDRPRNNRNNNNNRNYNENTHRDGQPRTGQPRTRGGNNRGNNN